MEIYNVIDLSSDDSTSTIHKSDDVIEGIQEKGAMQAETSGGKRRKTTKKSNTAAERKAKQQKLAEQKAAKKQAEEINKIYKPSECMKYMNVEGHPSLWSSWWCSDVSREVSASGARVVPSSHICHPSLVVWTRTVPKKLDKDTGQLKLTPGVEQCNSALYVVSAEEIAEHIHNHSLASHLAEIQILADCSLTLVVFGLKDYLKSPRRKTSNSNRNTITEIDFQLAITDLLVSSNCDTVVVNTPNELALLIVQMTKAIAEAPFKLAKRRCDDQAEFYMRGDSKKCVTVDKDGIGVGRLWQQMVAILPHSSLEVARAICSRYSSPRTLFKALQSSDSTDVIADIGVSRAAVPGSKARRVGPEFARKLEILFTAQDGNTLVD